MSEKREHHASRAAELLAGLGTTRDLATALGKSAGTIGDYRTGRRRPAPDVMRAIEKRWPQVPVELWDSPPRSQPGPETAPSPPRAVPRSPAATDGAEDASDAGLEASPEVTTAELHVMIQSDLARLRGTEGDVLELGKRSEVIRRLVAAQTALTKTTSQGSLTVEEILASSGGRELIALLAEALSQIPTGRWAVEHAARALASGAEDEAVRDLVRRQVAACYGGDLARRAHEAGALDPFLAHPDFVAATVAIVAGIGCQPCRDSVTATLRSLGATSDRPGARARGAPRRERVEEGSRE